MTNPDIGAYQPPAGPVTSLSVTGPSSASVVAGTAFNVTITAEDANGDPEWTDALPVTLKASDGQTVFSSPITLKNGTTTVSVTIDKVDKVSLTATSGSIKGTSSTFTVNPAAAASFSLSASSTVTAGAGFSLKVTALDAYGNVATTYGGKATLTASDGQSVSPSTVSFASSTATPGVATVTAVLDKVDTLTLSATAGSVKGTSNKITVNPAAAASFLLNAQNAVTAGTGFSLKVTALDAYGNVATGYNGKATLTASDGQSVSPSTVSFASSSATPGVATVTTVLNEPDTPVTLKATAGSIKGQSGTITVEAAMLFSSPGTWSGYAATPGSGVTAVGATWVQPAVTGSGNADSSIWVGIDGWNGPTVEQCGVQRSSSTAFPNTPPGTNSSAMRTVRPRTGLQSGEPPVQFCRARRRHH